MGSASKGLFMMPFSNCDEYVSCRVENTWTLAKLGIF